MNAIEVGAQVVRLSGYPGRKGHVVEVDGDAGRARVMWTHNPDGNDLGSDKKRTWVRFSDLKME